MLKADLTTFAVVVMTDYATFVVAWFDQLICAERYCAELSKEVQDAFGVSAVVHVIRESDLQSVFDAREAEAAEAAEAAKR